VENWKSGKVQPADSWQQAAICSSRVIRLDAPFVAGCDELVSGEQLVASNRSWFPESAGFTFPLVHFFHFSTSPFVAA
jgi:hypothetical protein